jgi:hypothetical protein
MQKKAVAFRPGFLPYKYAGNNVSLLIIEFISAVFWDVLLPSLEGRYQLELNFCTEAEYNLPGRSPGAVNHKTAICNNRKCHQTVSSFNCKTV